MDSLKCLKSTFGSKKEILFNICWMYLGTKSVFVHRASRELGPWEQTLGTTNGLSTSLAHRRHVLLVHSYNWLWAFCSFRWISRYKRIRMGTVRNRFRVMLSCSQCEKNLGSTTLLVGKDGQNQIYSEWWSFFVNLGVSGEQDAGPCIQVMQNKS